MNESTKKRNIELPWKMRALIDLIRDTGLRKELARAGGIYLWEDKSPDGRPAYIGKATSRTGLWKRQLQWYFMQINGQAQIPKKYRQNKEHWKFDRDNLQCIETITNKDLFNELVNDAHSYVKHITVYWVELPDDKLNDVEGMLITKLDPWSNSKCPKSSLSASDVFHTGDIPNCLQSK